MSDRGPVITVDELDLLDADEMRQGYTDGRAGDPEPGDNRSKAYWHGWRNGAVDGGHRETDAAGRALARAYLDRERHRRHLH
jgi:hypothetical protein